MAVPQDGTADKTNLTEFGGAGLIFEGLTNRGGCWNEKLCQGLGGVNPQRSNQSVLRRDLFWEMLFQKETGTAFR